MKRLVLACAIALISTAGVAQTLTPMAAPKAAAPAAAPTTPVAMPGMTCKAQAADKKLAGAAMNSFMKKCQTDASKACDTESKTQSLRGAAKTSHMQKCVGDAVGA